MRGGGNGELGLFLTALKIKNNKMFGIYITIILIAV
jgi:hypothetical protein